MSLTDFLLARIGEDEQTAREILLDAPAVVDAPVVVDPARRALAQMALAGCRGKRRIVQYAVLCSNQSSIVGDVVASLDEVLRILATPYADHPDFQPGWRSLAPHLDPRPLNRQTRMSAHRRRWRPWRRPETRDSDGEQ